MTPSRRELLWQGAGAVIAAALPARSFAAADVLVEMRGTPRGERVWFAPAGLAVAPATTVRFVNRDAGNSHTATAYHPDLLGRQLRIPRGAAPWDSGFLMPGEAFAVTLSVPGIYDLYCQPHEAAGMVARIVVGRPGEGVTWSPAPDTGDLPAAAMAGFPTVEAILAGTLSRAGAERRPAVPRHARPGVTAGAAPPRTLGAPHPTTAAAAPRIFRRHAAPAEG